MLQFLAYNFLSSGSISLPLITKWKVEKYSF